MKLKLIILSIFLTSFTFAQKFPNAINSVKQDSFKTQNELEKIKFSYGNEIRYKKFFLGYDSPEYKYSTNFLDINFFEKDKPEFDIYSREAMKKIQNNFAKTFQFYRNAVERKYDLGVVSQILGYASTAATLYLAGAHVYKYYIKKKK